MEKTLQEQYNLIKEGKGNKAYFLKSAFRLFPDMLSPVNTFEDTVTILKNRSIISEGIGGLVTSGKKQDWHSIFKENMNTLKEEKEAKAEEKETTKEVTDMATRGYDYKDEKNYDNVFGEEFLKGYYTELRDPKNADKHVEELRAIVAKNLAKDISYYVKNGQFGIKGVGYTTEAPGLGTPKEPKGKFKSSGYGDLKESVLRSQIHLLIKEVLAEGIHDKDITSAPHTNIKGKMGDYDPKARAASLARLANFGPKSKHENTYKKGDKVEFNDDLWTVINTGVDSDGDMFVDIKLGDKTHKDVPVSAIKKADQAMLDLDKEWKKKLETGDIDETKKPSAGLTKKEKSAISKKLHKGEDIGKKGKGFEKVEKAAEKKYGSKEAGEKVAAAAMWKSLAKESLSEALDMDSIKNEGEDAKKKVMERRITNEIVKRKKQIKALETLTELEGNEDNIKKVKELQSEIKKLEGAKAKLTKVKEAGTYAGKKAIDDMKKDPDYNTMNTQAKMDAEKKLQGGGSVTVGENKEK